MLYIKATAIGVLSAVILAVAWVAAALWLPIYGQMWLSYIRNEGAGAGASMVGSGSALLAALIGFVCGFAWTVRRHRRRLDDVVRRNSST
jgi:hypothetical protein